MNCECYPYVNVECEQENIFIDIITGPQGGNSAQTITKNQSDLILDLNENYYLEFLDNSEQPFTIDQVPVFLRINGVSQPGIVLDQTFSPSRIYGFANNDTQTIKITVI